MFLVLYTGAMSDFCLFTHTMLYTSVNGGGIALKLIVCVCFFGRPHQGRNPSVSVPRCFKIPAVTLSKLKLVLFYYTLLGV